jgi:hypothetical protein
VQPAFTSQLCGRLESPHGVQTGNKIVEIENNRNHTQLFKQQWLAGQSKVDSRTAVILDEYAAAIAPRGICIVPEEGAT